MRLREKELAIIISTLKEHTPDASMYLFGSRVDDNARGGDIDLFLSTNREVSLDEKISMLTHLARNGICRKVDLIIQTPHKRQHTLSREVMKRGIRLC